MTTRLTKTYNVYLVFSKEVFDQDYHQWLQMKARNLAFNNCQFLNDMCIKHCSKIMCDNTKSTGH